MEIDLESIIDKSPQEITSSRKQAILQSLEKERQARKMCIAEGKKFKIDTFEIPASPLSLNEENRPLKRRSPINIKSSMSKFTSISSDNTRTPDTRPEFMHNQLKEPDFEQLSLIYENYLKSPKISENTVQDKKTPKKLPSPSRSFSAPNTQRKVIQDLIKEREDQFKKDCTFKPKINQMFYSRNLNYNDNKNNLSFEQKIQQLSKPKSETLEKREKLRRERQEIIDSECTFKPNITPYKNSNRSFSEYPVDERLYQDAETKLNERERIKREKEEEIAAQFPFSPQVQSSVSKLVGSNKEKPPLYQRLEEVQKEINERKKIIRLEAEKNDPDLTFRPQINSNSSQLANLKRSRENSSNSRNESNDRKLRISEQYSMEDECTFTPRISNYSNNITTSDFLQRQKALQEKIKSKREEMIKRIQSNYTFKPSIDQTSKYIADSNRDRSKDRLEERLNKDGRKKIELQAYLQQDYYSQFTYEPVINPISKKLARSSSLNEIAFNQNSKDAKKKVAEEKAAEIERKCSFTPKIITSDRFKNIDSRYKQTENISDIISDQISAKKQKQDNLKKVYEYESMKECTFAPQNLGKKVNFDNKIKVKGMERFLELKEIAKRKEEEQKEREDKVFISNPSYNPDVSYTVPKPFNLHPSNKEVKIEKIKQEIAKKEQTECVFRPQTNE
jgi:hypothetical protein